MYTVYITALHRTKHSQRAHLGQCGVGCCYMFYKCAIENLHISTLFYIISNLNDGAAQLPLICKLSVVKTESNFLSQTLDVQH